MALQSDIQKLSVDAVVSLITIDATPLGGSTLRFTTASDTGGQDIRFNNLSYKALPSRIRGAGSGGRRASEPTLEVAENDATLLALIAGREDLTGAKVTRTRTLAKYLDGRTEADATQHWPTDSWRVSGLLARQEDGVIAWRLSSFLATDGAYLPRRQVLRDVCTFQYRQWDGTAWDYTNAECPYRREDLFFNINDDQVTDAAQDICSRRISGCIARFGPVDQLPFGAFIGVGRGQE